MTLELSEKGRSSIEWVLSIINEFKLKSDIQLKRFFKKWKEQEKVYVSNNGTPPLLIEYIEDFTLRGGKRIRPFLAFYTAKALNKNNCLQEDDILSASLSLELLQSYLLIHDDIMDEDEVRRGGPTVHVMIMKDLNDAKIGNNLAILAGDLCSALSQTLIVDTCLPEGTKLELLKLFYEIQFEVITGQKLDIVKFSDVEKIHRLKTTSYTTLGPMKFGAIISGVPFDTIRKIEQFALNLGYLFQLRDDWLGTFGDSEATGKSVVQDLKEGKNTIIKKVVREKNLTTLLNRLDQAIGCEDEAYLSRVKMELIQSGIKEDVEKIIKTVLNQTLESLYKIKEFSEEYKTIFEGITYLFAFRES